MREIKFRAWDKQKKEMVPVDKIEFHHLYFTPLTINSYVATRFELMQYTGLKDKNGKEIYEGDILRWEHVNDIDFVEWMEGDACYRGLLNGLDSAACSYYEVIGNIYENSELIKNAQP